MNRPLQILIAEDNPADGRLLLRALGKAGLEFEHHLVDNEADYRRHLRPELDVIISDYEMPQFGAMRALEILQESRLAIPFIIVSGTIGEDLAVEAMKRGAMDYLLKDRLTRIGVSVTQAIEQGRSAQGRLKAQEALRESEERFRQLVQNIEQVFWMSSPDKGEMLFVSAAYERIWGRSCESLYASPKEWLEAIHPDDRARILDAALKQQVTGTYHEEYRIVRPDGSVRWISDRAFPVRNAEGAVYRVAGIAEDITERHRVRESLRMFRTLVDHSEDTFEVLDPETGQFLDVNARGPAELGCSREEYLKMRVFDIDPLVSPHVWRELIKEMERGESARGEGLHVRKDGSAYPVEFTAKLVQLERPYVVASVRDITERKLAEQRVHEQAAMLDLAHDAIIVRGFEDGVVTFWNRGAEKLYGWTRAEAVGKEVGALIFLDSKRVQHINSELLKAGEWDGENQHQAKDGKKLVVSSRTTLVRDSQGQPKAVFVIHTDITEQKELEARFLRAQRMESIGTLASGVAHDLNNILAPILMSAPLLRRDLKPDLRENIISGIELSAERGASIVKQVLAFGRGLEGERQPMQIRTVIKDVVKILSETFPKNVHLETGLPAELWPIVADATQIHQILLNLCVNARDAMPCGGKLQLRASNVELDESYVSMLPGATVGPNVLLEVEDSGEGIAPEIVERIFDPFFTTKGVGKGTGLGLSTVLGIVKSHGGHISVSSEAGRGTKFLIHLPALKASNPLTDAKQASQEPPMGHGECVLVVDDEEHVRRSVRFALEAHGYTVLLAADGTDGLATFAQKADQIALVLTDLMMPYMDGVALIHALRRINERIPIVASTGLGQKRQISELEQLKIQGMLMKPYGSDALLKLVNEALAAAR